MNEEARRLAPATLERVVADLCPDTRGIALALNGAVVPRARWSQHTLKEGDRVELVRPLQGG